MKENLLADIEHLRRERRAVILAHTYQPPEIQGPGRLCRRFVWSSVKASQVADADIIVFCGVQFMAETAAILNPGRQV